MPSFEDKLVKAVKRKREAEGLSIRSLSAEVGISFSTLARIERREGQPDNNSKIRLLEWLGQDAEDAGLQFDNVAFVHFRAGKNIRSSTVRTLLKTAESLRQSLKSHGGSQNQVDGEDYGPSGNVFRSKEELEGIAEKFRYDLGLKKGEPLDSLRVKVEGVEVIPARKTNHLDEQTIKRLGGNSASEWSAMSVPLDSENENWAVLMNDWHKVERQRVTVMEEYWHILLGHKLTKIARVAEAYGRTYDKAEEHDAFYLAAAVLLPKPAIVEAVGKNRTSKQVAKVFGTSPDLVEYRIKRLGLWREPTGKLVRLSPN